MVTYKVNEYPNISEVIALYDDAELRRPTDDMERIERMYAHSNLIVTAWDEHLLVGVARSVTDFSYCCYLSDLAVRKAYQRQGVGKELLALTKAQVGDEAMLLLISAPDALGFYPKMAMQEAKNGFFMARTK